MTIKLSPHQYDIALTASCHKLGIVSNYDVIAFTHRLMADGYYDDIMLDIIDDDPLYPNNQIAQLLPILYDKLGFWLLPFEESRYFYTLDKVLTLLSLPPNINMISEAGIIDKFGLYCDEELLAQDLLKHTYQLSYDLEMAEMEIAENAARIKIQRWHEFIQDCQIWLNKHQTTFETIFQRFAHL